MYVMPKRKPFRRLRGELTANGLSSTELCQIINRSADYVSRCLNGRAQFTLAEQYALLKAINRPASEMHLIFPEGGVQIEELKPTNQTDGMFPNQNKKPRKIDQSESPIDQILHTTAETLRLQADLLDTLAETRGREKSR